MPIFYTLLYLTCFLRILPKILIQTVLVPELLGGTKNCRKVLDSAQGTITLQTTDRQTTDGRLMP